MLNRDIPGSIGPRHLLVLGALALMALWVSCVGPSWRAEGESHEELSEAEAFAPRVYEEGLLPLPAVGRPSLPDATERSAGMDALRRGLELSRRAEAGAAASAYAEARALLPAFSDWADLLAVRAYGETSDLSEVQRRVARFGISGAGEWAWRVEYEALLAAGDTLEALRVAERAAPRRTTQPERAYAFSRAGVLRAARGDPAGALASFREAMRAAASSPGGLAAARGAFDLPGLTPEDRLLVGRTLLVHGGTDRGVAMLEAYATSPGVEADQRSEARLEAGRVLFNARNYERAERNLREAAPASGEAAFLLGRTRYRQGRQEEGVRAFQAVAREHPGTPAAASALFLLGDLAHDDGRVAAAGEYYRQSIATGVHGVPALDAALRLAGMGLIAGNPDQARQDLERYLDGRPRDRLTAGAVYWLGRAHLVMGEDDRARTLFREALQLDPFSYYGMLAARRLGTSLAALPIGEAPRPSAQTAEEIEVTFFRIDLLRDLGLVEEADLELARLQEAVESDHAALYHVAEALARHGQPVAGALLGRRIQQARNEWDDRLLRIVFQFPHREVVLQESRRQGLDPFMVAGLIRQESFFNPVAVSPAGAVGLMQVMPQTASGLARRAGVTNFQASMLRDPATNVRIGTIYLADQMSRWGGRLSDVFGAYNAGPNRVVRWRQFPEYRDDEIYIERIPLEETRDYVKRVTLYGELYRRLYGDDR